MRTRHVAAAAVAIAAFLCVTMPALAAPNQPASNGDDALINQHLASLVASEQPPVRRMGAPANGPGTRFAAVTQAKPIHLAPMLLELAGRYNRAERLLHFQSHGFDANFWGAIGGGRMRLRYSVKF